jgi:hypothetical protein
MVVLFTLTLQRGLVENKKFFVDKFLNFKVSFQLWEGGCSSL